MRCNSRRSAGFGLPDLYVHHDAPLRPRSGIAASKDRMGTRSAEPCRSTCRGVDVASRMAKLCWRGCVTDAPRADAWRTRLVVHQNAQARCRLSRYRDGGLAAQRRAGIWLAAWRADVDQPKSK